MDEMSRAFIRVKEETREKKGIFGANVMVAMEQKDLCTRGAQYYF